MRLIALLLTAVLTCTPALAADKDRKGPDHATLGAKFLEENAKKEGVVVTESGLQYKIIKPGNDKRPKNRNTKITVHYQGKHIDGRVFDSTFEGEPASFRVREVIKGWQEGVQYVGEAGQIVLYVPPELAYGRRGHSPTVGRYETLIFIIVPVSY